MDGVFGSRVIDELRSLLNAWEAGREPYNLALNHAVVSELRRQEQAEDELSALSAGQQGGE